LVNIRDILVLCYIIFGGFMKKVIWYLLKGILYISVFVVIASLTMFALFLYVFFSLLAYGLPAVGYGHTIGYSDSSFKRWYWWRRMRDNG